MKVYVGNLSFDTTESQLREMFGAHGEVTSASLVMDHNTGRPRGFGFVEFTEASSARAAIAAMNGQIVGGRDLTVNEAKTSSPRPANGNRNGAH